MKLEEALLTWGNDVREKNVTLGVEVVQQKAQYSACLLGCDDFGGCPAPAGLLFSSQNFSALLNYRKASAAPPAIMMS